MKVIGSIIAILGILIGAIIINGASKDTFVEYVEIEADNGDPYVLGEGDYLDNGTTITYNGTIEKALERSESVSNFVTCLLVLVSAMMCGTGVMIIISDIKKDPEEKRK